MSAYDEVVEAAHRVERYLHVNCGVNADFPLDLVADNEISAEEIGNLLQSLSDALQPFRDESSSLHNPNCK